VSRPILFGASVLAYAAGLAGVSTLAVAQPSSPSPAASPADGGLDAAIASLEQEVADLEARRGPARARGHGRLVGRWDQCRERSRRRAWLGARQPARIRGQPPAAADAGADAQADRHARATAGRAGGAGTPQARAASCPRHDETVRRVTALAARTAVHRFEARAMGSPLRATLAGLDEGVALLAWMAVVDDVEASEESMSRFRASSEISRLNATAGSGEFVRVSRRLYEALATSRRAWRRTRGLFDPRVWTDLERLGYRGATWDGDLDPVEAASRQATAWVRARPRAAAVALAEPVDLGGIGKGLALRWAAERVMAGPDAPSGLLIDAGGDVVVRGGAPEGDPAWLVGIEDPLVPGSHVAVARVRGGICTSAPTVVRWRRADGSAAHHLIDPRTGEPAETGLRSMTVAAADPAWAEVWSKSLYLVGARHVGAVARRQGLAAWWVSDDGALSMTPAARASTLWTSR
jgi:thiamine biosynthesis lipoprotein